VPIAWNGPNQGKLRKALLKTYQDIRRLKRFATDNFEHSLSDIGGANPEDWAEDLIAKAVAEGWINDLYQKFCTSHSNQPRIAQLQEALGDTFLDKSLIEQATSDESIGLPNSSNIVARIPALEALIEDPHSAYLVIAVFGEKPSEQTFRVQPKLCYRDTEIDKSFQASLGEGSYSVALKAFPVFLKQLVGLTFTALAKCVPNPLQPWRLTIALFVPIDLLCLPLAKWCDQDSELLTSYPLVLGCSDRFDPNKPDIAADLHNKLNLGWQRFQARVRDGLTLQNLDWLDSDVAHQESFQAYSGFRCYGHWLKPGDQHLENWRRLIRSGIPLALWMCEGQPPRQTIAATFDRLTDGTTFELLHRIPLIRDEQQLTCNHRIGILYEDPNYVPEVPRSAEAQIFRWLGT